MIAPFVFSLVLGISRSNPNPNQNPRAFGRLPPSRGHLHPKMRKVGAYLGTLGAGPHVPYSSDLPSVIKRKPSQIFTADENSVKKTWKY